MAFFDAALSLLGIDHFARHTAIGHKILAGDKACLFGEQKTGERGNILGGANPPHRVLLEVNGTASA